MRGRDRQSFASRVREELVRLPLGKTCCMLSEIAALTYTSGHLAFRGGGAFSASYRLEDAGAARRLFQLLKKRLGLSPTLHFTQTSMLGGRRTCVLELNGEDTRTLLTALHRMETDEDGQTRLKRAVPRHPMVRQCCRRAFLRGAFLGAGSMANPEKEYHLELKAEDAQLTGILEKLTEKSGLPCRRYERKGMDVIYLKGAQHIADFLTMIGATRAVLSLENTRINKQLRAAAVRAANCDEHNSEKMLDAGQRQAEAIRQLSLKQGLFTLPPALQAMARARLENPDMSLKELGELMDPPLGKSAVNHRLRRLMEMAEELESNEEEGDGKA